MNCAGTVSSATLPKIPIAVAGFELAPLLAVVAGERRPAAASTGRRFSIRIA